MSVTSLAGLCIVTKDSVIGTLGYELRYQPYDDLPMPTHMTSVGRSRHRAQQYVSRSSEAGLN